MCLNYKGTNENLVKSVFFLLNFSTNLSIYHVTFSSTLRKKMWVALTPTVGFGGYNLTHLCWFYSNERTNLIHVFLTMQKQNLLNKNIRRARVCAVNFLLEPQNFGCIVSWPFPYFSKYHFVTLKGFVFCSPLRKKCSVSFF